MRKYALRKILLGLLAAACCSRLAAQGVPPASAQAVFVVSGGNQISQYTTSGVLVRTLTGGPLGSFHGLAFGADRYLYATNTFTCSGGTGSCNELEKFDPNTGTYLGAVGSITPNTNPYSGVTNQAVSLNGLALGPGNGLYVLTNQLGLYKIDPAANTTVPIPTADCCTLSVAFLPDGTPLSISSSPNSVTNDLSGAAFNTGSFTSAQSLAFGPDGRLYVLQAQEIDTVPSTGGAITQLSASSALGAGYFMTFDSQGHIWATDLNYGVREFDSVTGQQIGGFASTKALAFAGIAIGPVFGNVWAWGDNGFSELGNGTTTASPSPVPVSNLSNVVAIADGCCDDEFGLALKSDGTVWAWGAGGFGELGNGTTNSSSTPLQVSGLAGVMAIAANWDHALAAKSDGTVWAWGYNGNGELGNGTQSNSSVPVQVSNLSNVIAVAAGDSESMALRSDGTVWVWGYNGNGQLGIGTTSSAPVTTPVQVSGLSGVVAIAAGNGDSLVLKSDGTVWGWGYNLDGRLGNGTTTSSTTPVQASGLSGVIAIAAGDGVSLALKNDGSVWAWGNGPLGNGTTAGSTIPVQVQSLSGMTAIAAGSNYSLALKSDGTVWAWGNNGIGQLGIGTTSPLTPVTTPVHVNTISAVTAIAAGDIFSLAIEGQANGVATHFSVSAPASSTAGTSFNLSVTALDASNHTVAGYTGTVHFTSTDPLAALPVDYTFTAADSGTHVSGATLNTAGSQTITGTDTTNATITGVSGPISVSAAAATHFIITAPPSVTGGTPFSVTLTALDPFGNTSTSYSGTVHFTSTDALAVLPADYTFTAADQGMHVFTAVTLNTPGVETITATDTGTGIAGSSNSITVVGNATHFSVSAPASATTGAAFSVTVTALNAANQTSTSYTGTVVFTSTDPLAVFSPSVYTFTAADHGVHVFSVTLNTPGSQTITATDNTNASITGISAPIAVSSPPPPIVITDNETIKVSDADSFTDAFDTEAVHVADAVFVTPIIAVTGPVAQFSAGGLGFGGQSGTQTITVSDIGGASLTLASATVSGSSQFSIMQISCSSGATSLSTQLPAGGVCSVTINYAASATPAQDTAALVFNDNAALSNLPTTPSGASYTQSVPLTGAGTNIGPPPPPPAVIAIVDNETIQVTDTESSPDVLDAETITVSDQVSVTIASSPTATSISATGVTYGTAATATVSVSSLSGAVTGTVTLSVDGGAPSTVSLSNGSAVFNLGNLKAGSHSLSANFAAQGSFSGSSAQTTLVVNQATPTISWASPAPITYGTALSSTQLNATASVPGSFVYSPAAGTVLAGGIQTLSVAFTPTDATDYTTATASVTLLVNAPPVFTSPSATTFTVGTASSFTVTAIGIPAPVLSKASGTLLPTGVVFDPASGVLSGTPAPGTGGTYSTTFAAVNSVGTALQIFTLTVNEAPAITSNSKVTFVVGIARTFIPTATGFPVPAFAESGALPQGLSFAFNALSGTAAEGTEGTYNISFTASNGIGSAATQNVTLLVIPQSLPAFTSPNSTTFGDCGICAKKLYNSFTVTTTGNPAPSLTIPFQLPPGLIFKDNGNGTGTLSGSQPVGVYHITFIATGAGGAAFAATQSFTLNVVPIRTFPAFTSASQAAFAVGQPNAFTVAAAPYIDKITMSSANIVPLPSWLVLADNHDGTATLGGIPPLAPGNVYNITFTASNSGDPNYKVTQTFSLVLVSPGMSLPAFTSPSSATFGDSCSPCSTPVHNSFTVTTTGSPTPSLTAAGLSIPGGVQFTDNHDGTATLSGSPLAGVYHLTFTATGAGGAAFAATQSFTLTVRLLSSSHAAFTSASQAAFVVGQANTFTVAAAPFIDRITMSSANSLPLPSWLVLTDNHDGTATLSGVPPFAPNNAYKITFTAGSSGDPRYRVTQTFSLLLVLPGESLPAFTSPSSATFGYSCSTNPCRTPLHNSFTVTTTGNPTPSLTLAYLLPAGLGFTDNGNGTGTLFGHPTVGVYHITFIATGAGHAAFAATQSFTLTVLPALFFHAAFTSASQAAFVVGQANAFTVAAAPFFDRITMSSAPSWLKLTDNHDGTATLSGIPPAAPGQVYNITFTASNSGDPTYKLTQAFSLLLLP